MTCAAGPDDYRWALADQVEADGDAVLAAAVRRCAANHPEGCDVCEMLADRDGDGDLP